MGDLMACVEFRCRSLPRRRRARVVLAASIALAGVVLVGLASRFTAVGLADPPCGVTWTGAGGDGLWSTAGNWSGDAVPGAGDAVCIPSGDTVSVVSGDAEADSIEGDAATLDVEGGSLTLTDSASESTLSTLSLSGGELDVDGELMIDSEFDWSAGTLGGSGMTEVAADATGTVDPAASLGVDGLELVNEGTMTINCETADDPTDVYSVITGSDSAAFLNTGSLTLEGSCAFQQADSTVDELVNDGDLQVTGEQAVGWAMTSGESSETTIGTDDDYGDLALYGGDSNSPLGGDWTEAYDYSGVLELAAGGSV